MLQLTPMNPLLQGYEGNWFLILDGAVIENVQRIIHEEDRQAESVLLYYDTEYEQYCSISPCIVRVNVDSNILDRFRNEKKFADAGVLYGFMGDMNSFKKMLVPLIEAKFSNSQIKLFRFYDPHVLQILAQSREFVLLNSILGNADHLAWLPDISCYNDGKRLVTSYTLE